MRKVVLASIAAAMFSSGWAAAADRITLSPDTWNDAAPDGKEVDCIYGDVVLRNERLVSVIANPTLSRNANMTVKNVEGCLIDLTTRRGQSDQLHAYYPLGKSTSWQGKAVPDQRGAKEVSIALTAAKKAGQPTATLEYTLGDREAYLQITTMLKNETDKPLEVTPLDELRLDGGGFEKSPNGKAPLFWAYDKWFGQAYGVAAETLETTATTDGNLTTLRYASGDKPATTLKPGESLQLVRRVFPAASSLELAGLSAQSVGANTQESAVQLKDESGAAIAGAEVVVSRDGHRYGVACTGADGRISFVAISGAYAAEVTALGSGSKIVDLAVGETTVSLPTAGSIVAVVTDPEGNAIPCKVAFRGRDGTKDPHFGHMTCEHGVHNLYYSHNGRFEQRLEPGKYDVIVSHGPEYDAAFASVEITRGKKTHLKAGLRRSVDTKGWISSDFHSHSSPSGDNTASQLGRVLNLLCEHLEFAPCTEHNRISTYVPHLTHLGVTRQMATCSGIELTGTPLPLNHQNAFPLVLKERTHDGGGPQTDASPEVQIGRLALWDNRSEKLVQQNHPDLGNLFFDKNGDGEHDAGFADGLPFIDVVEVHPPHWIFKGPFHEDQGKKYNNTIFNWMQAINQGKRIPGVVNTDAHYNFHGSGFLRIYIQSPTDDPAKVETMDVVREAKRGHIIMTSGPFMEVRAQTEGFGKNKTAICGDELAAIGGKLTLHVRVQCPNWLDIDRVQVFVNGRPDEKLNFTREKHSDKFGAGVVKFEQAIPVELAADSHLIVAAAGEKLGLGDVMGPDHGKEMPIAVSNPIYVDVDGGGFKASGDTLGAPLPVKDGTAK